MLTWTCCITSRSLIAFELSSARSATTFGSMTIRTRAKLVLWSLAESTTVTYLPSSAVENSSFHSSAFALEKGR